MEGNSKSTKKITYAVTYKWVLFLLAVAGFLISLYTLNIHLKLQINPEASPAFCNLSKTINCSGVIGSSYGLFLGFPLGSYGAAFYVLFATLTLLVPRSLTDNSSGIKPETLLFLSLLTVIASLLLFTISKFVIGALCPVCMALYAVNLFLFIFSWLYAKSVSNLETQSCHFIPFIKVGFNDVIFAYKIFSKSEVRSTTKGEFSPASHRMIAIILVVSVALVFFSSALSLKFFEASFREQSKETKPKEELEIGSLIEKWRTSPIYDLKINLEGGALFKDYPYGDSAAEVTIVEYSDFECPACRKIYPEVARIKERYKDRIRFIHRDFPIDSRCNSLIPPNAGHESACFLANFTRCAGEQGRFWEALNFVYQLPEISNRSGGEAIKKAIFSEDSSSRLSLDLNEIKQCLESERQLQKIASDIMLANQIGLEGTPTILVDGRKLPYAMPELLEAIIKVQIDK